MVDIKKIKDAVLDMQKKIVFSDDGHTYQVEATGEWLQGVSTVSSIIPKDWLSQWGSKECAKFLGYSDYEGDFTRANEVLNQIVHDIYTQANPAKSFIALLKEAKGASSRKSKEALADGKAGHKWIENHIKARINKTELPTIPTGLLERPILQFLDWEKKSIKEWVISEALVAYPKKGYAGTLDALALMNNEKLAVIDFKFASHISEDHYLQTAGYQACFEPYGIKIDDRIIIKLPKTLMIEEWDKEKHQYKMVENNIEPYLVKTPYQLDRDTFFACLLVKKWINYVTKNGGK